MSIKVVCPNGHVLRVKDSLAGKTGLCPTCKARVSVPEPETSSMDESAILSILGPYEPGKAVRSLTTTNPFEEEVQRRPAKKEMRRCIHCEKEIEAETHICPYCKRYIGGPGDL
ncbi:MAG: hypothetical protein ACOX1P_01145 [Thermoguttaceae bacterium]|jgi:hypothetical protein